ncbi:MAG TPA: riboflavin synthase [Syntrophomonadaceae bacterium]|nr:riboflavin synthase [Syntrophomonadaceae bacterium]
MFTGLVEEIGIVRSVVKSQLSALLTIKAGKVLDELEEGDSIAVNGVCLTVTGFSGDNFTVDVMAETLAKTNLGQLHEGSRVNLERALKVGDRLDGHFVTGHVDATGTVLSRRDRGIAAEIWISIPEGMEKYFIPQGSVAVDGVSLTVAALSPDAFMVSLIPHTQKITTLGSWRAGDKVNIEADVLGKYIYHLFTKRGRVEKKRITPEFLVEHGFF